LAIPMPKRMGKFHQFPVYEWSKKTGNKFDPDKDKGTTNYWGSEINTERMDVSTKVGYVFRICLSEVFQNAFNSHDQKSYFGLNQYNIKQKVTYSNF
jgi:hypothetical protein